MSGCGFSGGSGGTLQWWLCAHGSAWPAPESRVVECADLGRDADDARAVTAWCRLLVRRGVGGGVEVGVGVTTGSGDTVVRPATVCVRCPPKAVSPAATATTATRSTPDKIIQRFVMREPRISIA
ncbi:hypothetical protein [Actinoallomurus acaciae]|uniref:hypothetical protein n=1 Tax=Actinoallomurus acaciae TaxID=502577 RepID=UPI00366D021B